MTAEKNPEQLWDMSRNCHVMVDLETDGLHPGNNSIIEIGAVAFQPGRTIENILDHPAHFQAYLYSQGNRSSDQDTAAWRQAQPGYSEWVQSYLRTRIEPDEALKRLGEAVCMWAHGRTTWFWAKPTSFDWPFLDGYYRECKIVSPFNYRNVMDLRTYLRTLVYAGGFGLANIDTVGPKGAEMEHRALADCVTQINFMARTMDLMAYAPFN